MAKTTEQLVQEMLDREAIRELPVRYCHCVWTLDTEAMVSLFTPDGLFSMQDETGAVRETKGAEALRAFYGGIGDLKPRPFIHNHLVELLGDGRAQGVCYVEVRAGSDGMKPFGAGYYHDEYLKAAGAWKFQARRYHAVKVAP